MVVSSPHPRSGRMALRVKVASSPSFCATSWIPWFLPAWPPLALRLLLPLIGWAFPSCPLIYTIIAVDFFPSCLRAESKINGKGIKSLT